MISAALCGIDGLMYPYDISGHKPFDLSSIGGVRATWNFTTKKSESSPALPLCDIKLDFTQLIRNESCLFT